VSIGVVWDNDEKSIIRCDFNGKWRWDDLFAALDQIRGMSAAVPHTVDAIIDFTHASYIPTGSIFSFEGQHQRVARVDRHRGGQRLYADGV
jgi:hypothetical protein